MLGLENVKLGFYTTSLYNLTFFHKTSITEMRMLRCISGNIQDRIRNVKIRFKMEIAFY